MDLLKPLDRQMQLLSKVLDLRAEKAQVISANIANAETPGYSPSVYDFEKDLSNAINRKATIGLVTTDNGHIPLGPAGFSSVIGKIREVPGQAAIGDENGVNVEQEMIALSENEILYETSTQLLNKKLSLLKHVISGGQ
jgi:flagellar basal-body rod protein FlgB